RLYVSSSFSKAIIHPQFVSSARSDACCIISGKKLSTVRFLVASRFWLSHVIVASCLPAFECAAPASFPPFPTHRRTAAKEETIGKIHRRGCRGTKRQTVCGLSSASSAVNLPHYLVTGLPSPFRS